MSPSGRADKAPAGSSSSHAPYDWHHVYIVDAVLTSHQELGAFGMDPAPCAVCGFSLADRVRGTGGDAAKMWIDESGSARMAHPFCVQGCDEHGYIKWDCDDCIDAGPQVA